MADLVKNVGFNESVSHGGLVWEWVGALHSKSKGRNESES
jgi:hypothetical protein